MMCSLGEVIKRKNVGEVPWSSLQEVKLFTLVNLELVQSLASWLLSPAEAVDGTTTPTPTSTFGEIFGRGRPMRL